MIIKRVRGARVMFINWKSIGKSLLISIICVLTYLFTFRYFLNTAPFYGGSIYLGIPQLFAGFFAITFVLGTLFNRLPLTFSWRFTSVFAYFFFLTGGLWTAKHLLFGTGVNVENMFILAIIISIVTASLVSFLFQGTTTPIPILYKFKLYLRERSVGDWFLRVTLGILFLFVTFFLMHEMIFPFLEPYYNSQSSAFYIEGSRQINQNAMLFHSIVLLFVLLPLFALWTDSKSSLLFWVGFPIFLIVAVLPFIMYSYWPMGFRFPIFIEMTATLYIQSMILVHLFYIPNNKDVKEPTMLQPYWKYKEFY